MSNRYRAFIGIGIVGGLLLVLAAGVRGRAKISTRSDEQTGRMNGASSRHQDKAVADARQKREPRREVDARAQGLACQDAALHDLIQNARVAARRGDKTTREAMLTGLKREPERSRTLIESALAKAADSQDVAALNGLLGELP